MMRLKFWPLALLAWLTATVSLAAEAETSGDARPNVIVIIGDDHSADVYGAYGSRRARTPNLDRLAAEGMRFDRAWCATPVCTASRQSLLTGRAPAAIGVTRLSSPLPESEVTLADTLAEAGYATATFGKMHFNTKSRPGLHGFERLFEVAEAAAVVRERGAAPLPEGARVQPPWRPFKDPARVWLNSACLPAPFHIADMPGSVIADRAIDYLRERAAPEADQVAGDKRPFFLIVSFPEPHSPYYFPVEFAGMFNPEDFTAPMGREEDRDEIPEIFRDLTDAEKRGIIAAYHTSAAFLDHCVGRVLDEIDRLALTDSTLTIYLGDHGYMLGERGRFEKHAMWERAVRAPLVARWPGHIAKGSVTTARVEFIDLFPTVANACGAAVPGDVEGRDLGPILRGETSAGREMIFSAYHQNEEAAVRDERYKLIYGSGRRDRDDGYRTGLPLPGRRTRLYDMIADPDECNDLLAGAESKAEHESRVQTMKREMLRRLSGGTADPAGDVDVELDKWLVPVESREGDERWR